MMHYAVAFSNDYFYPQRGRRILSFQEEEFGGNICLIPYWNSLMSIEISRDRW